MAFIIFFREEDVTQTMYRVTDRPAVSTTDGKKTKVDTLCDSVRQALLKISPEKSVFSTFSQKFSKMLLINTVFQFLLYFLLIC